jgi:ankyrin repeat protein
VFIVLNLIIYRTDFIESVNRGDWSTAAQLARFVNASMVIPGRSVPAWLIDLNAPSLLVVAVLEAIAQNDNIDLDQQGLLGCCLEASTTKSNSLETFAALLSFGISPNSFVDSGETVFQKALARNLVEEVKLLLTYGVDPYQMSLFGDESTSRLLRNPTHFAMVR